MNPSQDAFVTEVEALYEVLVPLFVARSGGEAWGDTWSAYWDDAHSEQVLRRLHTIKVSARVLNRPSLVHFVHALEDVFHSPALGDILAESTWFERIQDCFEQLRLWASEPPPDEGVTEPDHDAEHECQVWRKALEESLAKWQSEHQQPHTIAQQLCEAFPGIEQEIYPFLNREEEHALLNLLEAETPVWVLQIYFSTETFAEDTEALRGVLSSLGEVVSCTGAGFSAEQEPIFNYVLGCDMRIEALQEALSGFPLQLLDAREPPATWLVGSSFSLDGVDAPEITNPVGSDLNDDTLQDAVVPDVDANVDAVARIPSSQIPVTTQEIPEIRDALAQITKGYLASFPEKIEFFRELIDQLEEAPDDAALIDESFRFAHSLKGTAGTLGLAAFSELGGIIEELLDAARADKLKLRESSFNCLYVWCDVLEATMLELIDDVWSEHSPAQMNTLVIKMQVQAVLEASQDAADGTPEEAFETPPPPTKESSATRAAAAAAPEENAAPAPPASPRVDAATPPQPMPGVERAERNKVSVDAVDSLRISLDKVDEVMNAAGELIQGKYALAAFGSALEQIMQSFKRYQTLWRQGAESAAEEVAAAKRGLAGGAAAFDDGSALIFASLVPQMEALQAHFEQLQGSLNAPIQSLRDGAIAMRMVPIKTLFYQFPRMVRQVSRSLHKKARLTMVGEHTELDKMMLEQLNAPLVHIIRNAIDHAIESPEEREAAGKPPHGEIVLKAYHRESAIIIEVSDDGAGIDPQAIGARAVALGLLTEQELAQASDQRLLSFLFTPGFTTRDKATELSGRGVGMDVVKTNIEQLQGRIRVQSTLGVGTTISLKLPLTLSIIRALVLREGDACYMLPSLSVLEVLYVREGDVQETTGGWSMQRKGRTLPLYALSYVLGEPWPYHPFPVQVVVVAGISSLIGLIVERVETEEEAMIKPMGSLLQEIPCVAGVAMRPRGEIAIVLESGGLLTRAMQLAPSSPTADRSAVPPPPVQTRHHKRILLVEDSPTSREMFLQLLAHAGFAVVSCRDGLEAWELLQGQHFDLLLTDLLMPGLNGVELLRRLRADEQLADLPAMMITGQASDAEVAAGLEAGADAYLSKRGFSHLTFLKRVCELLGVPMPTKGV